MVMQRVTSGRMGAHALRLGILRGREGVKIFAGRWEILDLRSLSPI